MSLFDPSLRQKELEEEALAARGGLYPHPWRVEYVEDCWDIMASNDARVTSFVKDEKHIAQWICDQYNKCPVSFLKDNVVYY